MLSFLTEDLRLTSDISKSSTCFPDLVILLSNPKSAPKFKELPSAAGQRESTAVLTFFAQKPHDLEPVGQRVWSTDDPEEPWLGQKLDGAHFVPNDVYHWEATYLDQLSYPRVHRGTVIVAR